MPNSGPITSFQFDQLKEVINIGASHASTALSQIINRKVNITVPEAYIDNVENISKYVGDEKDIVTAVLLKVLGDAPGMMIYLFPKGSENEMIKLLTKKDRKSGKLLDEYERSALREIGNILSGASLSAFSKFLNINVIHSVSEVTTDMLGSVVNSIVAEIAVKSDQALISKIDLKVDGSDVKTTLFFFLDPSATSKILDLTEKKLA